MTDAQYTELVEMHGKEYADAAREAVHSGDNKKFMELRASKGLLNVRSK